MIHRWTETLRESLRQHRNDRSGWGYGPGSTSCVEPTALVGLALSQAAAGEASEEAEEAAGWLASVQQPDGALGISAAVKSPCWGTAWAILLWQALDGWEAEREKAVEWLLGREGKTLAVDSSGVVGHDTSIPGWPWVAGTHPWLEPTATAVLALRSAGRSDHPRVGDGVRLICDRATPGGGWNYGNTTVFGRDLRPQPAPTGLALLALVGMDPPAEIIRRGCGYLKKALPHVRAPRSLGWGLLGLTAWQERPEAADGWLEESYCRVAGEAACPLDLAQLLLATDGSSFGGLAVKATERGSS